jgi:PadR family transcriptional regulator, regulatory protein PadR
MAATDRMELLQGTLELLILRVLRWGPHHGHGIATAIRQASGDQLTVEGGSLYPALQRLLRDGCVTASWSTSTNNRRARYYTLTAAGRRRLGAEQSQWDRFVRAIGAVGRRPSPKIP